jgi:cell division protein FtsN
MEKQKIFWVVLSVSVFVVVVLVVGVFLLKQKPYSGLTSAPGTVSPISDLGTQVYEYQRETTPRPAAGPAGEKPPENTQTMHFYIGEGGEKPAGPETQPATTPPPAARPPEETQKPAIAQAVPKQVTPPAQAARPAVKAVQKPAPIKPPAQTRTARRTVDYWIQTGSYKSQTRAEELAALLSGKGLSARLFSYASRNETYYRVRIGPYGNKREADKFLSIVKQIQGLESSYLSMVGATRNLN